jgi:5S rRNA maturation endonuclease (ribonuclease M5)
MGLHFTGSDIAKVAHALLGDPNPKLSKKHELRFGTHGSLSVEIDGEHAGTWYDHEAEVGGGVLELLRARTGLVNGAAFAWLRDMGIKVRPEPQTEPGVVAAYDYTDEAGTLLFQVVRKAPKRFIQRRPNAKGGWIWNMKGAVLVPFNLPAVIGANTVYVVEGEKDVLNLARLGVVATTNPGGAKKWRADFARYFAGKTVIVLPDNDDAGREHAKQVVANLKGTAARVAVLDLPNLPHKGDVSDWIQAGGTAEALERLAKGIYQNDNSAEPEAKAEAQYQDTAPGLLLSLDDWLSAEINPPDFLMGEVFHTESRAYLIGPTGLGKTNFSMALAAAMAAGTDFLHWKASGKCRKVLYVDGEMGERLMVQRIQDVVRRHGSIPGGLSVLCRANAGDMPPLNTEEGQRFIETIIDRLGGVDFIVFDNLQALVTGSLREEESFAAVLTWAKTLTSKSIGQIWVHHTGLDETRGYGDKSKEWQFDTVLLLKRAGEDGEVVFDLEFTKARERTPDNRADFAPVRVSLADDAWTVEGVRKADGLRKKAPSPGAAKVFTELCNAINADDAKDATSTKERWKRECWRRGMMATEPCKDGTRYTKSSATLFNQYVRELVTAGWIVVDGEGVRIIKNGPQP